MPATEGDALSRDAVARVLRRAAELAGDEYASVEGIDEASLIAAADEAGIPPTAVRRALAIERLGPPPAGGGGDAVLGPAVVLVETEVHGAADDVVERVDHWLVAGHHLRRDRRRAGRTEFSRRRDPVGRVMRAVRSVTGEGQLGHVRRIAVAAQDTGTGTSMVRIEADRADDRRTVAAQGTAVAVVGTVGVVTTAVVLAPAVLLATPVAVLAGVGVAARGRQRAKRVGHEVERVLDAVDQRSGPTRLTTDAMRRVANRRSG